MHLLDRVSNSNVPLIQIYYYINPPNHAAQLIEHIPHLFLFHAEKYYNIVRTRIFTPFNSGAIYHPQSPSGVWLQKIDSALSPYTILLYLLRYTATSRLQRESLINCRARLQFLLRTSKGYARGKLLFGREQPTEQPTPKKGVFFHGRARGRAGERGGKKLLLSPLSLVLRKPSHLFPTRGET